MRARVAVAVHADAVAQFAAQQFVHGHVELLAPDVPQGDFHAGTAALHLPQVVVVQLIDVGRVAADEHLFELLDGAPSPLAEADNAFVGEDFQQGPVAMFRAEGGRNLNVGDLHGLSFAGKHRKRDFGCAEVADADFRLLWAK